MKLFFFFLVVLVGVSSGAKTLISQTVAEVNKTYMTSRQVILTALLSSCLKSKCSKDTRLVVDVTKPDFADMVSKAIFEQLAFYESAEIFKTADSLGSSVLGTVLKHPLALKFQFERREVLAAYRVKALAQKYIQFKDKNLSVYVTTADAKKYYEANSAKFGGLGFKQFEQKIKVFLQAEIKKERVENWVLNMQQKYRVRQFLN